MFAANTRATIVERLRRPISQRLVYFGLVPLLVLLTLLAPPVGLIDRWRYRDYTRIDQRGGQIQGNGVTLQIPAGTVNNPTYLRLSQTANLPAALPGGYEQVGAFTEIQTSGTAGSPAVINISLANPTQPVNQQDLYAWEGAQWKFLPNRVENNQLVAEMGTLPPGLILLHSSKGQLQVSSNLAAGQEIPPATAQRISQVYVNSLVLDGEEGSVTSTRGGAANGTGSPKGLLASTNVVNGVVRSDWLNNILTKDDWRNTHVKALAAQITNNNAAGLAIDYRQVDPALRQQFTTFAQDLAQALHTQQKSLALILPPSQVGRDGRLDSGGYDWAKLGEVADQIVLRTPDSPTSFAPGGAVETMLNEAVRLVDRRKLSLMLRIGGQDISGAAATEKVLFKAFQEALAPALNVAIKTPSDLVAGKNVELDLPGFGSATLKYDPAAQTYFFTYTDTGQQKHTVWLEDAASLGTHLALASNYHLAGVFITGLLDAGSDPRAWDVVQAFLNAAQPPALPNQMAIRWTIVDEQGKPVLQATRGPEAAAFSWQTNLPGNYLVRADLSTDGGLTVSNQGQSLKLNVLAPTSTPTATPSPTSTPTNTPTPLPSNTPTPTPKPTNTAAPTALANTGGGTVQGAVTATPVPAPVAAAPPPRVLGGGVDYGVQADMMSDGNHGRILGAVQQLGFHWVKQQVEWKRYEPNKGQYDFGALDTLVSNANAAGIRVMFSVVKAPRWARPGDTDFSVEGPPANPQDYGDFMSALASHFSGRVGAYEIWNEQNLWYEWGGQGGRISPRAYIELLKRAYVAVKNADPNAVVISGALTPTGVNDGSIAMDDRSYLEQMYQLGLANFCDAVGAHPSGFNNPPDADWQTWSDPAASGFKGHPSFFFRGTMEGYRNIMAVYGDSRKKIWVTEFGWATVDHLGVGPAHGYEYAATNTEQKQADWLVKAFQMAQNWGWVGTMFVWNLNFAPVSGAADEKAAFGLVRSDWSHRPAFDALANMAK
ncbi:MAG: hypothetical protein EXR62_04080 [Chloroflexi bacterium]|nr:hypothetical protein [Chloroflexota bacterium]